MSTIQNIHVDRDEVLRYLGYRGHIPDERTNTLIESCIAHSHSIVRPKTRYICFSISRPPLMIEGIELPGNDIARHLNGCSRCVLMAATLGLAMDNHLYILQSSDILRAVVMEAVASAYMEAICNALESDIREEMRDYNLTSRFSPGYGDFPLSFQPHLLRLLDTGRKIGLYCNDSYMMTPRKSVTALLGVRDDNEICSGKNRCLECSNRGQCIYEKR